VCGFTGITLAYNTDSKESVDRLFAKVKRLGGIIQSCPKETSWGGYHFYFTNIDGYYWEIAYVSRQSDL